MKFMLGVVLRENNVVSNFLMKVMKFIAFSYQKRKKKKKQKKKKKRNLLCLYCLKMKGKNEEK